MLWWYLFVLKVQSPFVAIFWIFLFPECPLQVFFRLVRDLVSSRSSFYRIVQDQHKETMVLLYDLHLCQNYEELWEEVLLGLHSYSHVCRGYNFFNGLVY